MTAWSLRRPRTSWRHPGDSQAEAPCTPLEVTRETRPETCPGRSGPHRHCPHRARVVSRRRADPTTHACRYPAGDAPHARVCSPPSGYRRSRALRCEKVAAWGYPWGTDSGWRVALPSPPRVCAAAPIDGQGSRVRGLCPPHELLPLRHGAVAAQTDAVERHSGWSRLHLMRLEAVLEGSPNAIAHPVVDQPQVDLAKLRPVASALPRLRQMGQLVEQDQLVIMGGVGGSCRRWRPARPWTP
jgi:hypothetical protein